MTTVEQFRIGIQDPKAPFSKVNKRLIQILVILYLLFLTLFIIFLLITGARSADNGSLSIVAVVLAFAFITVYFRVLKEQRKKQESYVLSVGDGFITRELHNTQTISIRYNDISKISTRENEGFVIQGNTPEDIIYATVLVNERDKLEKLLSKIHPITILEKDKVSQGIKNIFLLIGVVIGVSTSLGVFIFTQNKIIIFISGTLILLGILFSNRSNKKNKNLDNTVRIKGYLSLMFIAVLLSMIYRIFELDNEFFRLINSL